MLLSAEVVISDNAADGAAVVLVTVTLEDFIDVEVERKVEKVVPGTLPVVAVVT